MRITSIALWVCLLVCRPALAVDVVRVGVLAFGTLSWEMRAIQERELDVASGLRLEVQTLAGPQAGQIALQANGVDVALADWSWVSRQRESGRDFVYAPYSTSYGALLVPVGSPIHSLDSLVGRRIGVAGGALDKNWLLLRAVAVARSGANLAEASTPVFGAPPLLAEQLRQGRVDALLTHWHSAVRLEAAGFRQLVSGQELIRMAGVDVSVPGMGYVFRERWALEHPEVWARFWKASREAQRLLCEDDALWASMAPLMAEDDAPTRSALRQGYCAARVALWGEAERLGAERLYALFGRMAGDGARSGDVRLDPGVFWSAITIP